MDFISISKRKFYTPEVVSFSSQLDKNCGPKNLFLDSGFWSTDKRDVQVNEYGVFEFQDQITFDYIEMEASSNGAHFFPKSFRLEISQDNESWCVIHSEKKLSVKNKYALDLPLTQCKYLKVLIYESPNNNYKFFSEIGTLKVGIYGIESISASSNESEQCTPQNLLHDDLKQYWSSKESKNSTKEFFLADLGKTFHINRLMLGSADMAFPEYINIETSIDEKIWTPLVEEKDFISEQYKRYYWDIDISPARYIRIEMKGIKKLAGGYGIRIGEFDVSAAPFNPFHTHNIGDLTPHASIFQTGIVKLSKDGDNTAGMAVQASDSRLRDASTIFKGIVQLAEDKESNAGLAVQASDTRLMPATEMDFGVVRLAYDRENNPGKVVQSNDSRLQHADEDTFGIVKVCPDGQYNEGQVINGNDIRLHLASEENAGICRLAEDGSSNAGSVVQANDHRLRDATTMYKGIVELADDGEEGEGIVVQANDRRLKHATVNSAGIVELAHDGEDREGVVVQGNDKRLKEATIDNSGIVKLAHNGEDKPGVVIQGNDKRLKDATVETAGIVRLAENGEVAHEAVVQSNDKRLKDATTVSKGIVQLAEDGSEESGKVVQGSDKRLKTATSISEGIVKLAANGSVESGAVVQGDDNRLRDATVDAKGIVELAEDGENKEGVAVQGNDKRLKNATIDYKGIVQLADDGSEESGKVVQGNDKRLKIATTTSLGIVELAEDGEEHEGVVVQGNDKRLKSATTFTKGLVELAENKEEAEGVVVQGNDDRLKEATEDALGIIRLAKNGEIKKGTVIQSDDERLSDAREPLHHTHDYAASDHNLNSHDGTISITDSRSEIFNEITPPSDESSIIYAKNDSIEDGSIGLAGISGILKENQTQNYGVVGHSNFIGIRGQSTGFENEPKGCGVLGVSRFGTGGLFASEHDFSLTVDGYANIKKYDSSLNLLGNGKALYVNGDSELHGTVHLKDNGKQKDEKHPLNIVEMFEVDEIEYVSQGDLLVVSEKGNSVLSRSRSEYNRAVIGVVSGNPSIVINNAAKEERLYPVALAGKVMCKVDARNNPINPGDLIVTSNTPGCGMKGSINSFEKVGTVVGKALSKLEDGVDVIPIFLMHQ